MAIKITCPGCKSALTLADELRGKKVRCKKCETVVKVPDADAGKRKRAVEEEEPQKAAANSSEDESEDEEDDRPKKKKKKKAKNGISPVLIIVPVLVLALLLVGGVSAFFLTRDNGPAKQAQAKVEQKKEEEEPKKQVDPNPDRPQGGIQFSKKGSGNLVSNIRGSAYVTERKNELSNIGKFFILYANDNPNVNKRKLDDFITYIQRDSPTIHKLLKEEFYTMNMKANISSGNSIIAYEPGIYPNGYLCVRGDGSVDYVLEADWKQALGK